MLVWGWKYGRWKIASFAWWNSSLLQLYDKNVTNITQSNSHVINFCVCFIFIMNKFSSKKWRFYASVSHCGTVIKRMTVKWGWNIIVEIFKKFIKFPDTICKIYTQKWPRSHKYLLFLITQKTEIENFFKH